MLVPHQMDSAERQDLADRKIRIDLKILYHELKNLDYSKVLWGRVFLTAIAHFWGFYGLYLLLFKSQWKTFIFGTIYAIYSGLGITMGAHRLWSHRSFKATLPLRIVLAIAETIAFQHDIIEWSRLHRVHHKCSESDGDPHNARRGLFFSHFGWWLYERHPEAAENLKNVDLSDLYADPVARYQHKYYFPLVALFSYIIPTFIPWYFWNEKFLTSFLVCANFRHICTTNFTYTANSLAHWIGNRPYDKTIYPSENKFVAYITLGEGWHNYHHVFPNDYRASEFAGTYSKNFTTKVIHLCHGLGLAYDLKTPNENVVKQRKLRTGSTEKLKEK